MRIIHLDVDSLRPDHTTPYGYGRDLTPHVQSLADRGVVVDGYHVSDSPCVPSRGALLTQRFGLETGIVGHYGETAEPYVDPMRVPDPDAPYLPAHLRAHGYRTAAVSTFPERHLAYWFHGGFSDFLRPDPAPGDGPTPGVGALGNDDDAGGINDRAEEWLRAHGQEEDWFLYLTYWDVHNDYVVGPEWVERARAAGPRPAWPDQAAIDAQRDRYGPRTGRDLHGVAGERSPVPHTMPDQVLTRADLETLIDGYDATIAYWDHHPGRLLALLDELGLADSTAVVVTADHGESFGEHGVYADHCLATTSVHHVPLVVAWPGLTDDLDDGRRRVEGLRYHLDLGPTLCDLLGLPTPPGWSGTSFAGALRGDPPAGRDHLVLSHGAHTYQRAVRTPEHLYLQTLHPGCFNLPPEQLFDLRTDPHLEHDLVETEPAVADRLRSLLQQWWTEHATGPGARPDRLQTTLDPGPTYYFRPEVYAAHLDASGRPDQAADFRRRLGLRPGLRP